MGHNQVWLTKALEDVPGSFQSYVTAPANYLNTIPPELSDKDAAPLMCAGVTVYDALKVFMINCTDTYYT